MFLGSSQAANVSDLYSVALELATNPTKLTEIRDELDKAIKQKAEADLAFAKRLQETEALGNDLTAKQESLDSREQEITLHENNYQDLISRLNEREASVLAKEKQVNEDNRLALSELANSRDSLNRDKSAFDKATSLISSELEARKANLDEREISISVRENNVSVAKADLDVRIAEASRFLKI